MSPGPLEENILHAASKHKLSTEQELLEKRRRFQSQIEDSSPELSGPSPAFSDREISSEADQDEECRRLNDKDGMSSHLHLLGENHGKPVETSLVLPVSVAVGLCLKKDSAATPSHLEGEQKEVSVIHGELEEQMPDLVTDSPAREGPCCISAVGSVEEVDKRPFVAVVGISKAMAGREAPIQLVPLGWEERLDRPKAGGKGLSHNNPLPKESKKEDLDVPKTMDQRDRKKEEAEELRKTVENISAELKRVSAQQNLLRCKVEELEQEKSLLKTDLLKSQQELAVLRTQETGVLYWSKKHMAYHHAELQELKTKLERNLEEKTELKERLKETEMHLERLREAQTSCKSPEREDLKSTTEKLRTLRVNVSLLLMSVLPHLELPDDEPDQVDEILQTVLETNGLLRKNPMP
uniref:Uncharacterized protein n=1 Tax=Sphenodon punctatus TaxID=8508 RepID=A0A8D0HME0_SPHPU